MTATLSQKQFDSDAPCLSSYEIFLTSANCQLRRGGLSEPYLVSDFLKLCFLSCSGPFRPIRKGRGSRFSSCSCLTCPQASQAFHFHLLLFFAEIISSASASILSLPSTSYLIESPKTLPHLFLHASHVATVQPKPRQARFSTRSSPSSSLSLSNRPSPVPAESLVLIVPPIPYPVKSSHRFPLSSSLRHISLQ